MIGTIVQQNGSWLTALGAIIGTLLVLSIITAIGQWKVFKKAGRSGWAAFIPIYNVVALFEITGKSVWWVTLLFVPIVGQVVAVWVMIALAKRFGKGAAFGVGLGLLGMIFFPILGFSDAKYLGGPQTTCPPMFVFIIYLVLTQLIRDNYPFSHYPMYSKPNSESLAFQYLADGESKPLQVRWYTGMSPAQLAKRFRTDMRKNPSEEKAAQVLLADIRERNQDRPKHALPDHIQLMEDRLSFDDGKLVENKRVIAGEAPKP